MLRECGICNRFMFGSAVTGRDGAFCFILQAPLCRGRPTSHGRDENAFPTPSPSETGDFFFFFFLEEGVGAARTGTS